MPALGFDRNLPLIAQCSLSFARSRLVSLFLLVRSFLTRKNGDSLKRAWSRSIFFWNPLFSLAICCFLGGFGRIYARYLDSLFISNVVVSVCFLTVYSVRILLRSLAFKPGQEPVLWTYRRSMSISLTAMPIGLYLAFKLRPSFSTLLHLNLTPVNADDYRMGLLLGSLIAFIIFLGGARSEAKRLAKDSELKIKQIENERLEAQLSALTAQMNPHLLFNALNSVASLIPVSPTKAEEVILKLADLYRAVLNSSRKRTHSLAIEIEICEAYLSIEKTRFAERLQTEFAIGPEVDVQRIQVPALSLQPLVENAVKHGIAPLAEGGKIRFSAAIDQDLLRIAIEDNGVGATGEKKTRRTGTGTGIKNCRDRLALHFGERGALDLGPGNSGGTLVSIAMPVLIQAELA